MPHSEEGPGLEWLTKSKVSPKYGKLNMALVRKYSDYLENQLSPKPVSRVCMHVFPNSTQTAER